MNDHLFLEFAYTKDAARYLEMHNYEDSFELTEATEIGDDYPSDVEFRMNNDFPDVIGRDDFLHTLSDDLVIQTRVRTLLEERDVPYLQFLDIVVKDHKGRPVPETFHLVNFTEHVDCIDREATQFEWDSLDEDEMSEVSNLTLLPAPLEGVLLARVKHYPELIVIARSLADEMTKAGFTGFRARELSEWDP